MNFEMKYGGWWRNESAMPARGLWCLQQFGAQLFCDERIGAADIHRGKRY
jgi:hypothetical protein